MNWECNGVEGNARFNGIVTARPFGQRKRADMQFNEKDGSKSGTEFSFARESSRPVRFSEISR